MTPSRPLLPGLIVIALTLILGGVGVGVGCSNGDQNKPRPLAPQFVVGTAPRSQRDIAADPMSGADQPGALYRGSRVDPNVQPAPQGPGGARDATSISSTVQDNVTAPGTRGGDVSITPDLASPTTTPGTQPATTQAAAPAPQGIVPGQFLTIGGVVADVNATPIYANKVLRACEPILAARAKDLTPTQFKTVAVHTITDQIRYFIRDELEYAAAERNLDQKDKDLADYMMEQWRKRQETVAGSMEVAKRLAKEHGQDFDDMMHDQYRLTMIRIYLERKVRPRIQVNAADMRDYYDRHIEEFTDRGVAQFRLIKIDIRKHDGRENSQRLIEELRNRIVKAGERFDAIAHTVNDDPRLLRNGGELGKIDQGAFAVEPVDKAVWATPDGQITPAIDTGDAFYLALVEEKKTGTVVPFEDEAVQNRINKKLSDMQFLELREKNTSQLVRDAVVREDKDMVDIAVDMAMQNYPRWASAK